MTQFHAPRRAAQIATLLIIALIPMLGLFRIDLASASFVVLGQQMWWSNFPFIAGLALVLATAPILTYMTISTAWCGWACPQNLLSEWANNLTYRLLGKRADVRVDGKGMVVAAAKNKVLNWLILGIVFLAAAMVLALIPVLYFLPFNDVWEFVTFRANQQLSSFITFPYFFLTLLIFVDIAFIRYFVCDYACLYRVGHLMFKSRNALRIGFDASRSADCSKCNYCATVCITKIQPTEIKDDDHCTGCGECIDACNRLHQKSGSNGLLHFAVGSDTGHTPLQHKLRKLVTRFNVLIGGLLLLGIAMMAWGIATQKPLPQPVPPEVRQHDEQIARACNNQCAALITSCKERSMAGCYRASACKCACNLEQDPGNAEREAWQQCVARFTGLADRLPPLNR